MRNEIFTLSIVLSSFITIDAFAQTTYANTQTNGANGVCVGCSVVDPNNCVSASTTDYSIINLTAAANGAQVWLRMQFPATAPAGTFVNVVVEDLNGLPLTAVLMSNAKLTTYNNNASNNDTKTSSQYSIQTYNGSQYIIGFTPVTPYNTIELRFSNSLVGALTSLRVYMAYYTVTPLPVEFLYFNASQKGNKVMLEWATGSETNNDCFVIEKSSDGNVFEAAGSVKGAGSSAVTQYYSFEDAALPGTWYYRLRQRDFDGTCTYSDLAGVECTPVMEEKMKIFPNPLAGDKLSIVSPGGEDTWVEVRSLSGTRVMRTLLDSYAGEKRIDTGIFEKGIYILTVSGAGGEALHMQKLVVE